MGLYEEIESGQEGIAVTGLGYVGLPLAVAFAKKAEVIGFDRNREKIALYKSGIDPTREIGEEAVRETTIQFTSDEMLLREAKFHIIAVPTPINADKTPDLTPVKEASRTVGRNLTEGSIVVYESTVFPGVTEDICVPILERESGLVCGRDFKVGYSPERINPGDRVHRLENITKIVSGMDGESLEIISKVYSMIVEAGVYPASSIKVAEAAKVVENSQRDINIAFMNELALVFDKMGIDTFEVIEAMNTKWNALGFYPGLVGGHCIGVDPYYFIYRAELLGYHSQIIAAGRKVNDSMGKFVAEAAIKQIIRAGLRAGEVTVCILGFTFKENCPDTRNTRVIDIAKELREYGINPLLADPVADSDEAKKEYGVEICRMDEIENIDVLIIAVAHQEFAELGFDGIQQFFRPNRPNGEKIILDVKALLDPLEVQEAGYRYWRL